MTKKKHPAALSFTGGKDCMLALSEVLQGTDPTYADIEVRVLVTFGPAAAFTEAEWRRGFKAHPLPVIKLQAQALGLPHLAVPIDGSGEGGYMGAYQVRTALRRVRER